MKNLIILKVRKAVCCMLILALATVMLPVNEKKAQAGDGTSDQTVVVNLSQKYQEIRGYGGMNHPTWAGDLSGDQRNTAFNNGNNQLGFTVLRIWIDSNSNNWWREVETAKAAIQKGTIVFATPWNPPDHMREVFGTVQHNGQTINKYRLKHDKYGDYINHINNFVQFMKNNGVELYAVSLMNEPDYGYDWTWYTETEVYNLVRYYAGNINCRVIAPESFSYRKSFTDVILNDPNALANVEILGTHLYGTQYSNFSYPLYKQKGSGKDLWMTEVYVPNSDPNSNDLWPQSLEVAYHIHSAMINDFQTYVWWYIRRNYGPMKEDGTISKRGDCMAQFSKFVRPGYRRVGATENPRTGEDNVDVHVSAYTGDNKAVIVAINKGNGTVSQQFEIQGASISRVNRYRTSGNEKVAETKNLANSGKSFWASLPGNSVSTFVCDLGEIKYEESEWGVVNNGGFEDATASWDSYNGATLGLGYTTKKNGKLSLKVSERNNTFSGASQDITGRLNAGTKYYINAAIRYNSSENAKATGNTTFHISILYGDGTIHNMASVTTKADKWAQINGSYTVPANANLSNVKIFVETNYTANPKAQDLVTFFVDDLKITKNKIVLSDDSTNDSKDKQTGNTNKGEQGTQNTNSSITTYKVGRYIYVISNEQKKTAALYRPVNKNIKKANIKGTVIIKGIKYRVTSISKGAFKGCQNLKKVTVGKKIKKIGSKAFFKCKKLKCIVFEGVKLKSVGKKAFKKTNKKFVVKAPKAKLKQYRKLIKKSVLK